jgi:hypothetical protein
MTKFSEDVKSSGGIPGGDLNVKNLKYGQNSRRIPIVSPFIPGDFLCTPSNLKETNPGTQI